MISTTLLLVDESSSSLSDLDVHLQTTKATTAPMMIRVSKDCLSKAVSGMIQAGIRHAGFQAAGRKSSPAVQSRGEAVVQLPDVQ
jgi:hypothetical protein